MILNKNNTFQLYACMTSENITIYNTINCTMYNVEKENTVRKKKKRRINLVYKVIKFGYF